MIQTPQIEGLSILGTLITVIVDTDVCTAKGADGLYEDYKIYLKEEYEDFGYFLEVLNHESFHALCEILGIQLDIHTEEILANTMSKVSSTMFNAFLGADPSDGMDIDPEEPPELPNHIDRIGLL